ncbi:MAG: anti-phage deoxyguanosine triphosphatase [Methylococcaceae bacterium]
MDSWEERKYETSSHNRDDYARDRARIIHSASFRRLQGKTQVLGLGESDFYRTRLTHSLEVAQIAGGIAEHLYEKYHDEYAQFIPSQNLIEAIGLAHDIGHSPFGHGGEVALNYAMRNHGGFEGNAQTLRICTQLGEYSDCDGLNLTRRTLLGLIKYPATYSRVVNTDVYDSNKAPLNIDSFYPPKCSVFDCDQAYFHWILEPFSTEDVQRFLTTNPSPNKHSKTQFKSFDTSIMELADDIAYGIHDLEDGIALNLITEKDWLNLVTVSFPDYERNGIKTKITQDLFSGKNRIRKKAISYLVNYFVSQIEINARNCFASPLLDLQAVMSKTLVQELEMFKRIVALKVIETPEVQTLVYKGQQMILRLFEALANNPQRLLEQKHYAKYLRQSEENDKLRVICDYIAGDTDEYATRLYHKIFTPSNGSVFDRL